MTFVLPEEPLPEEPADQIRWMPPGLLTLTW